MATPWVTAHPELVEDIRKSLDGDFRNLHLFLEKGRAEVRGSFPVVGADGRILDRYSVRIVFPDSYPRELPAVQEVGGRIPRTADRHVFSDSGNCCVLLADARWESFPVGASLRRYLEVPLHNYFLGQSLVEQGEPWPFKDWGHGAVGVVSRFWWKSDLTLLPEEVRSNSTWLSQAAFFSAIGLASTTRTRCGASILRSLICPLATRP
jgi:hypothetical protein